MLEGVLWSIAAIAVVFVSFRVLARIKMFKRLYWDDFFVLLALIFQLVTGILWQTFAANDFYEVLNVFATQFSGPRTPGPSFLAHGRRFFATTIVFVILFNSTLWAIKLSFLIFFKRLFNNVIRHKLFWWPVFGFTVASYLITFGVIDYRCLGRSTLYIVQNCGTKSAVKLHRAFFLVGFFLDVLTDLASKQKIFPYLSLSRPISRYCNGPGSYI